MADPPPRLPDDVLADILARVAPAPHSLAVSRCVCREWRAVVDERCRHLLRTDLLPLRVGGIFVESHGADAPDFFARPSVAHRVAGKLESFVGMDGGGGSGADDIVIVDCCNGLLLVEESEVAVANPATRRLARLPPCDGLPEGHEGVGSYWHYLAFDPMVSPHYEMISMQHPSNFNRRPFSFNDDEDKKRLEGLQWPPPVYVMRVYSSRTRRWEERRFALDRDDDEGIQRSIDGVSSMAYGHAAYWHGVLYVHCNTHFILRINLLDDKYRVIDLPADADGNDDLWEVYLGKSKNGIYFAAILNDMCRVLVWFLDDSSGKLEWILKHSISQNDLIIPFRDNPDAQTDKPWIFQNENSYQEIKLGPAMELEKNLDWDSDDDESIVDPKYYCDIERTYGFMIFGFHPYKDIVFLHSSRVVAYHFSRSMVQDLGKLRFIYTNNDMRRTAFIYTPCWVGDLSENSY